MNEESVFAAALGYATTAERRAFLDEACGGDAALHARVEQLLGAHERTQGILDYPIRSRGAEDARLESDHPVVAERVGSLIAGRYKLVEEIGEGGMGSVWVTEQTQPIRRKVALKLIKAGMDSKRVLSRFEAERQALALMDHPNIAKVLDGGTTETGRPFFVMEYVRGVPITKYCDEARLTINQRLALFVPVCQAVQHAHTKGIIHRDLKPSNILVCLYDAEPVPKVIDFGLAKATHEPLTEPTLHTAHGFMLGTPLYMSPEQAEFNNLDVDTRTDIYSLGVILYELLTGTTPLERQRFQQAAWHEMLHWIREEEPQRPSARLSGSGSLPSIAAHRGTEPAKLGRLVKGDLDWIVMKCLEKDRSRRYETANGLARDVQRYRADESVEARPPSAGYRLSKLIRRNSRLVLATSVITLVLLGGIIGTCWGLLRATAALDSALRSERLATDQLFQALLNRARAGRFSGQMGQRLDSLVAVEQAARIRADERVRDEAIAAMALPDIRRVPVPGIPTPSGGAVAYGRQYSLYAWANRDGFISVRSIPDDHEIRRIASKPSSAAYFEFSPDDQFLLRFGVGRALRVWRVDDGRLALPDELRDCQAHAFSPDGRRLAVGREGWILHFDMATGREERRWRVPARAASLAFHPDSGQLAVGYDGSTVASVFGARGELVAELPVGAISAQVVTWHPDGKHLAISGSDPRIQIWEVAARRKLATLTGHVKQVTALTFHPDGGLLASHSWDGVLRLWDPATGRPLLQLPLAVHDRPRFSGDGRWLGVALQGERAELLEVTPSREYRTLYSSAGADAGSYNQADISPDGRMLVVGIDGGTRLWDLRSGREIAALPAGTVSAFFEGGERSDRASTTPNGPRALLTSGPDGLQRWPITSADLQGELLRLGPPRQLSPLTRAWFARSPEGRTLAAVSVEGGVNHILDLDTATVRRELGVHPAGEVHALSGDGRWAASTGWHSDRVRLWNLDTGQMVHEWVLGKQNYACFTIDSRTLIIGRGDEYTFWDLATLQPIRRLPRDVAEYPGYVAFSPDGKLMALEMAPAVIHLKEVATGRTVAKLEDPHGDRATWQGFTPDSTQLVVVANYASAIHVWDLRAIRSRLKDMNLDWVWREFPPTATEHSDSEPQQIQVLPGDLPELTLERRTKQKIERWRRAVEANPDSADACNNLAWAYVTAPKPIRDVDSALPLAEKAVRLAAGNAIYRNTLGVAYYRAGRYREAVEVLRPNLMRQDDSCLALDLYFLAMTHHCLGETARARDFYDWAVRWTPLQRDLDAIDLEELAAFRAEAEEMLGVDGM